MIKLTENLIQQRLKTCTTSLDKVTKINITGRELQDISLLRRMTGVEILSLSVNNISTLVDLQNCKNLKELYLRHNNIKDLNEICYLQELPKLELLLLSENPCTKDPLYRLTVIKNLRHLTELDGTPITVEERKEATKLGKDVFSCEDPIDHFANCIPDGPQIQRTPTQSAQYLKSAECNFPELSEMKTQFETVTEDEVSLTRKPEEPREIPQTVETPKIQGPCEVCGLKGGPLLATASALRSIVPPIDDHLHVLQCKFCKGPNEIRSNHEAHHFRQIQKNSNILSAALNLIKELDFSSLQIINAEISSRLNTYQLDLCCH